MWPERDDRIDHCVSLFRHLCHDGERRCNTGGRQCCRWCTTAGAEARAGVCLVVGGCAVFVAGVGRMTGVPDELRRVVAVLRALVEAPRIQDCSLEPERPDGDEGTKPDGAGHHDNNTKNPGLVRPDGIPAILGQAGSLLNGCRGRATFTTPDPRS